MRVINVPHFVTSIAPIIYSHSNCSCCRYYVAILKGTDVGPTHENLAKSVTVRINTQGA